MANCRLQNLAHGKQIFLEVAQDTLKLAGRMGCEPTVLIVDDETQVRELLVDMVRGEGISARGFSSGEELLASSELNRAACVVLDLRLPAMQGMEVMENLRARNPPLPVVVLTGYGNVPSAVKSMKAGAVDYLEKPIHPQVLVASVREAIQRGQMQREGQFLEHATRTRISSLTQEERDVYRLLLAGLPNKQIASTLHIGLRTVELRRANLLKKMNAGSLPELVRLAILGGLTVETPSS